MSKLSERLRESPSVRNPPYRGLASLSSEERAELGRKLGSPANYGSQTLRGLVAADPTNIELRKALVSSIMSAEFAGIDAFSRKVCEWQEWPVPWTLIFAMARQTWDEVRHAQLAVGVLESYGGKVGEYPDTLAGGNGPAGAAAARNGAATETPAGATNGTADYQQQAAARQRALAAQQYGGDISMRDPVVSLSMTNVSLEGAALVGFKQTSELGEKIGDQLLAHCYDYNWADEVTHTAIGDWFIKEIAKTDPDAERRALVAHARHERQRNMLNGEQTQEIVKFFEEEDERAEQALGAADD